MDELAEMRRVTKVVTDAFDAACESTDSLVEIAARLGLELPARLLSGCPDYRDPRADLLWLIASRLLPQGCEWLVRETIGGQPELVIVSLAGPMNAVRSIDMSGADFPR